MTDDTSPTAVPQGRGPLSGVIPIPVTTFDDDGRLDTEGLASQVRFSLESGAHGVLYPGVVSEFYTLTDDERRAAVETVVTAADGRVPAIVGVTGASTAAAVAFAEHARSIGADAVMSMVPYVQHFFAPTTDFAREHMTEVARAAAVPVILQNARVGFPLGVGAVTEVVRQVHGVRYVKQESNPPTHGISEIVSALGDRIDGVFGGVGGVYLVNELDRGAVGTMPSPAFVDRIVAAYDLYRGAGADAAQQLLETMGSLFTREVLYNVVFHKEVLRRRGVITSTRVRIASPSLDAVDLADLDRLLDAADVRWAPGSPVVADGTVAPKLVRRSDEEGAMFGRPVDVPMHSVVRTELLTQIRSGRLHPGDQVPTEPQLMAAFGVSRTTVRRALRDLETMGLIDRQPGRGSFVSEPKVEPKLDRLTGFVEDMEALGLHASAIVELIESGPADAEVSQQLQLAPGETVVHIERVRLANGTPISFDDSYFPADLGSRIATENLEDEPFYSILESKYGIALAGADYVLSATTADERVARLLSIAVGAPVLRLERTSRAAPDRRPILFEHLHFAGARISYRLTLDR